MRNIVLINFVVTLAVTHSINDQSINVALETILEFDGKERVADLKFIDQMQSFLKNIEKTMDKRRAGMVMRSQYKKKKRKQKKRVKEIEPKGPEKDKNISEYFSHIADVLSSFDKREVFAVFKTVEEEIKKRHKKNCKFNELLENPNIRRSINSGLQTVKQASSSILDAISKQFVSSVEETQNNLQNLSNKFYSWLNMFYNNKPPTSDKFHEIIQELDNYSSSKQKPKGNQIILEDEENHSSNEQKKKKKKKSFDKDKDTKDIGNIGTLVDLVKKAMNYLFFDSYLQMDQDSRITVQEQLQNFENEDKLKEQKSHEEDVSLNTKEAIMADTKYHISNNIEARLENIERHLKHSHLNKRLQARQLNSVFNNTWLTNSPWGNLTNGINGTNPNSTRGHNTMPDLFFPYPKPSSTPKNKSTNTIFGYKPKKHKGSKNHKKRRRPKLIAKTGKRSHKKYSQKKYSKHYKKMSGGKTSKDYRKYSPSKDSNEVKTLDTTAERTIKPTKIQDNLSDLSLKNKIKSQESIEHVVHKGHFKKTLHTEDSTDVSSKMTEEIATTPKKENKGKIKKSKKAEHKNKSKKSKDVVKRRKETDSNEKDNEAAKQTTSDGQKIIEDKLNNRKISEKFTKPALTETNLRTENTLGKETKHDDSNSEKQETTVVWVPRAELKHDTSTDLIVKRNDSARLDNNWSTKNEVHSRTNQEEEHNLKTGDHNQTELVPDKEISASITNTSKDSCSNMTCMATTETVNNTNTQRVNSTTTDSGNTTPATVDTTTTDSGNTTPATVDTFIVYKTLTPDKHTILSVVHNMTNKSQLILYDDKDFLEAPSNQTEVTDNRTPTTKP